MHDEWNNAMNEEVRMIEKNITWSLVPRPRNRHVIGVKWIFQTKLNPDDSVNKYKARLIIKGCLQLAGVDYGDTFAPMARHEIIRLLLALAAQLKWNVFHLDVKSAFLNCEPKEKLFVEQPKGFKVYDGGDRVYQLHKALYGLKQAPRACEDVKLFGYADSDCAGCPDDFKSTTGYLFSLGSSVFLCYLAQKSADKFTLSQASATVIVDNQSAISMAKNHVPHGRTKHINVKFHAVREAEQNEEVELVHCNNDVQVADILTKSLSKGRFEVLKVESGVLRKNLKE
ncbi:UNVERIFIED_CONTAM: Retrovirus-related Pol polyprotein from transposon RE2 [Sesamum latifolium]|uniref:Retrovirus-related Pol polyprotein from transposon RE2 n=1 Tax=Sesamum latifolium TaxID=2727402 RepID=A0AAW2VZ63_9LAMI